MAETSQIADIARKVAKEIFSVFGWRQVGHLDQNWPCTEAEHGKKTHPTDVVFYYEDPYSAYRAYINTDLKSYGGSSIDRAKLSGALKSLAATVECANSGPHWRDLYDDGTTNHRVSGMLFVFNHDEGFKDDGGEFKGLISSLSREALAGAFGYKFVVLGPSDISFLYTVASDIQFMRGREELPSSSSGACSFWYADLVQTKRREQEFSAATIEMLTGPWVIMRAAPHRYTLWYRGQGGTEEEFRYLIEYLFFYQLLNHETAAVEVRFVASAPQAEAHFERAKDKFDRAHHRLATQRLQNISCTSVSRIRSSFATTTLGWNNR